MNPDDMKKKDSDLEPATVGTTDDSQTGASSPRNERAFDLIGNVEKRLSWANSQLVNKTIDRQYWTGVVNALTAIADDFENWQREVGS